jgi:hypothetical protein
MFQLNYPIAAPVGGFITSKVLVYNDNYNEEYVDNCVYSAVSTTFPCLHCAVNY